MKLSNFNLNAGVADEVYPYTYTIAESMFPDMEFAVGYGSILLTPCYGTHPITLDLHVLIVEDGEYGTGDCRGKGSLKLWAKLNKSIDRAAQFRLGVKDDGVLAKGTLVAGGSVEDDQLDEQGIDLVLPRVYHAPRGLSSEDNINSKFRYQRIVTRARRRQVLHTHRLVPLWFAPIIYT
jgi:hypothetical protein